MRGSRRPAALARILVPGAALVVAAATAEACVSLEGLTGGKPDGGGVVDPIDGAPIVEAGSAIPDATVEADAPPSRADQYREAVLSDSPLGYWRFDELTGTDAKDERAKHPGFYRQAPSLGRPGIFGDAGAIAFPEVATSHVELPGNDFRFGGLLPFTFEAWVLPRTFRNYQWIAGTETSPPRVGWSILATATGELLYEVFQDPSDGGLATLRSWSSNRLLELNRFQHIVVSFDGGTIRGYIDGQLAATLATTRSAPDTGVLLLGCRKNNDNTLVNCLDDWALDEVAIYDHPLEDDRVLAHYQLGKP